MQQLSKFIASEDGATSIEYGMIGGLISIVIIGALHTIGPILTGMFFGPITAALG